MILKEDQEYLKTLMTDKGSEFSNLSQLENGLKDIEVFFTHAYSAWEKGTNERHNRMLREFLPKGTSFKNLTYQELAHYTNTINNCFRKILDYQTPNDCYIMEVAKLQDTLRVKCLTKFKDSGWASQGPLRIPLESLNSNQAL